MTFDLEKAREAVHILENFAFASGKITTGQIQDILWGARLLAGASTEIERLRATIEGYEVDIASFLADRQTSSYIIRELRAKKDENALLEAIEEQAARIQELEAEIARVTDFSTKRMLVSYILELEDALVEERARALWFEGDDPCDPPNLDWKTEPNDIPESVRLLWGESARQQLQAEGKIGPEDAKPRSWKITDERRRALSEATTFLSEGYGGDTARIRNALQAMLEEADQE